MGAFQKVETVGCSLAVFLVLFISISDSDYIQKKRVGCGPFDVRQSPSLMAKPWLQPTIKTQVLIIRFKFSEEMNSLSFHSLIFFNYRYDETCFILPLLSLP